MMGELKEDVRKMQQLKVARSERVRTRRTLRWKPHTSGLIPVDEPRRARRTPPRAAS